MKRIPIARIHGPNDIRLDRCDMPVAGPADIVIEVKRCGICGSDISYTKIGGIPGAASPFSLGHEFSGIVVEAGELVSHVSVGDRVVVNPEVGGNGIGSAGIKGAFSPYVLYQNAVDFPQGLIKLPDELDFDLGALVEPLSVGMHAINQGKVKAGEKVVVFGAGPVGISAAVVARYYGAGSVIVVDLSEHRLAIARQMGFETFCPEAGGLRRFLLEKHGVVTNDQRLGEQLATDVFIEATGVGSVFQRACEISRKGGRIVVVAVHFAPVELNMLHLLMKELQITAAIEYPTEFPDVIEMLLSGKVDVRPMITHQFPLSAFGEAFQQACKTDEALKVLVDCQA